MTGGVQRRPDGYDQLEARVEELELLVRQLVRRNGPRDQYDITLLQQIAASTKGMLFSASELFAHANVDADLLHALGEASIGSGAELACCLRYYRGHAVEGLIVQRRRRRWTVSTCATLRDPHDANLG